MTESFEDFLEHHGVKGQKWGVRRALKSRSIGGPNLSVKAQNAIISKARSSRASKKDVFPEHPDHTNVADLRNRPVKSLSNKELKDLNQRLQLQKQYKELKSEPALKKVQKGHSYVKEAVAITATATAIYTFAKSPLGQEIRRITTEAIKSAVK